MGCIGCGMRAKFNVLLSSGNGHSKRERTAVRSSDELEKIEECWRLYVLRVGELIGATSDGFLRSGNSLVVRGESGGRPSLTGKVEEESEEAS